MPDISSMSAPADMQAEESMAVGPMEVEGFGKGEPPSPDIPPGGVEEPMVLPAAMIREQIPEVRTSQFIDRMV